MRSIQKEMRRLTTLREDELMAADKELRAPFELALGVARSGKLPVPNFAAGGVATPADAALMMALGAEAIFVGSGIFKSEKPEIMARGIVRAVTHWEDADELARISEELAPAMKGLDLRDIEPGELLQERGW